MSMKYCLTNYDIKQFFGQFILTKENKIIPEGWTVHEEGQWRLCTLALPVINVYDQASRWLGWCIGHPIIDGYINPREVILHVTEINSDVTSIENFYQRASGKWILVFINPGMEKIFMDPYGSLAAVYSTIEKTVASTPTLLGSDHKWDEELIDKMGLPENDLWLPSGLTARKNVSRLLPNHYLCLRDWGISRHWPSPTTDLSIDFDTASAVETVVRNTKTTIGAISAAYSLCFTITAGRDSRMLLACARDHIDRASFFTFESQKQIPDMLIPTLITNRFKLNHQFLKCEYASREELENWLSLTGMSSFGRIWKIHKSLEKLDYRRVLLPGTSGEVHKGVYWRPNDKIETKISAQEVLQRCGLPLLAPLVDATKNWLADLQFLNAFAILDLVHIEQRLGCWAAPQHYGNTTSAFEIASFNSRSNFHTMMRLPHEYRKKKQFVIDVCKYSWPDLLDFPFNEFTGVKGYFYSQARRVKKVLKAVIH